MQSLSMKTWPCASLMPMSMRLNGMRATRIWHGRGFKPAQQRNFLVRDAYIQHGQFLRQAPDMVQNHVIAHAEDARDIAVGFRIEAHAVGKNTVTAVLLDGFFCVEHQVLRIVHVDVRWFAVRYQQDEL